MNQKPTGNRADHPAVDETIAQENTSDTDSDGDFSTDAMPDSLGRYRIEKLLGRGGMGAVYLAHDGQLDRKVALKIPKFGANTDEKLVKRFYREARSAANLSHPNLCPVFDVGEIDGTHYIAMAYIQGRTLSSYVNAEKPPPPKVAAALIRKVAIAMEEAHQSGILHRDLKPANIMVDQRKEPIVMDFGLACPQDSGDDSRLTQDGALLGSPAYMSPEQLKGQPDAIGKASDVYSLGVVLYELLAGRLPFHGAHSTIAMISRILTEEPADIITIRGDLDPALAKICRKAMAKDVAKRFDSMKSLATALGNYIKTGGGETGTLADKPKAVRAADVTRIQLTEQSRLAKSLCEAGQFVAAAPILEQIIANPQGQDTKMVQWAKATLPRVKAKIAQENKSQAAPVEDVFSNLPATPAPTTPLRPVSQQRPVNRSKINRGKQAGSNRWMIIAGCAVAVLSLIVFGMVQLFNSSADASSQSTETVSTAVQSEPPSSREVVTSDSDTTVPNRASPQDRPRIRRQGGGGGGRGIAEHLLVQFDHNDDGFLDETEIPPPELDRMLEGDANGDRKLSFEEIASMRPLRESPPGGPGSNEFPGRGRPNDIMSLDSNGDGRVSASEIPSNRRFLLKDADSNGDGFIDATEASDAQPRIPPRREFRPGERGPGRGPGRGDFDDRRGRDRPGGPGPGN